MKYTLRIKKNRVFKYIFRKGEYFKGKYVVMHCCKTKYASENSEDSKNFFAVCVSKKNGNSVNRNKLKRLAREVYKEEELKLKKNYNIVIMYKKDTLGKDVGYYIIKEDIINCLKGLDLYE